ncbi:YjbF family lipoprotein [Photobacterium lutimaris]|uniref:YjbF family lipoprotein n=1 Tax=Photobacterium lutimaris TaxID=388278 RepID=A0A2T3INC3_9GAMM|nr:YjbF family lipoprotein [Photobacterium lutimaris]PSU29840.1 YjbF family lipoprotein [Photobacterium lutimaris]TDR75265.1 group 4 capsule polysaccharide lipoprotein GfcB/YjbF [Photobacterium lutimaris]
MDYHRVRSSWSLFALIAFTVLVSLTAGCSQNFKDVNDTMSLAFWGEDDASLNAADINQLPYASLYAQIEDGPQAFMVLALAEDKPSLTSNPNDSSTKTEKNLQLKWLSSDKGMLVTQAGRLVKTLNLPQGNLVAVESDFTDPLALGLHLSDTPTVWQYTLDWQPGYHYGYQALSQFEPQGKQVVTVNEQPVDVLYFVETVSVEKLNIAYQNEYWLSPNNGQVIKSRQKPAPNLPYIELTILKPFA